MSSFIYIWLGPTGVDESSVYEGSKGINNSTSNNTQISSVLEVCIKLNHVRCDSLWRISKSIIKISLIDATCTQISFDSVHSRFLADCNNLCTRESFRLWLQRCTRSKTSLKVSNHKFVVYLLCQLSWMNVLCNNHLLKPNLKNFLSRRQIRWRDIQDTINTTGSQ